VQALTIAGVVPLCFVLGGAAIHLMPAGSLRLSGFDRAVLAPVTGIAILTPVFVLLGVLGVFSPLAIGIAGWISAIVAFGFGGKRSLTRMRRRHRDWDRTGLAVLVLAAGFIAIAALGRDEPWGAGRDQQVYAEFAEALSDRGNAAASLSHLDSADRTLVAELGWDTGLRRYVGIVREAYSTPPRFVSYLPLGWPVWLALAHAIGGETGLSTLNAVFAALGGLLLYVLCRRIVGPLLAAGAAVALLLLPSTIWIAGTALSEPLALMLWLAIATLLAGGGEGVLVLASVIAFSSAAVRVDSIAVVPAILAALLLGGAPSQQRAIRRGSLALCVSVAATMLWYRSFHAAYFYDKVAYLGMIAGASIALTIVILVRRGGASDTALVRTVERFRAPAITLLVLAFAYGVFLRPSLQPFSHFRPGTGLEGMRDFREDSLWNFAAYLGWPLLVLALGGLSIAAWRWFGNATGLGRRVVLIMTLLFAAFYLWFPNISPDQPWAARRFVPAVIPGAILFAAYALRRTAGQDRRRVFAGAAALPALGILATFVHGTHILTLRENAGVATSIDILSGELPTTLVVADLRAAEVASALFVAKGKSVLIADLSRDQPRAAVAKWIDAKTAHGSFGWLLHLPELSMTGLREQSAVNQMFTREFTAPTTHAPARDKMRQEFNVVLSRIDGFDDAALFRRFGAAPTWNIAEHGFLPVELTQFGTLRLTNGDASLRLPSQMVGNATAVAFDFFLWSPSGKPRKLEIRIDGRTEWDGPIDSGVTTIRVPLRPGNRQNVVLIEIVSETFDTQTIQPGDRRGRVGVALLGTRLEAGARRADDVPGIKGFRSRLEPSGNLTQAIARNGQASLAINAANVGSRSWPSLREQGIDGAVQFGLRWYRKEPGSPLLADNRWPLALTLLPGEQTRLLLPLVPVGLDGSRLMPGDYMVNVGMVREKHAWFADGGDPLLTLDVTVVP